MIDQRTLALAAADAAGNAVVELIRFFREGPKSERFPFDAEVEGALADALRKVCQIAREYQLEGDEPAAVGEMIAALDRFQEVFPG